MLDSSAVEGLFRPEYQVIIFCGPGKQLMPLSDAANIPKPMLPIANVPMLSNVLGWIGSLASHAANQYKLFDVLVLSSHSQSSTLYPYLQHTAPTFLPKTMKLTSIPVDNDWAQTHDTAHYLRLDKVRNWLKPACHLLVLPCDLFISVEKSTSTPSQGATNHFTSQHNVTGNAAILDDFLAHHRSSSHGTLATSLFFERPALLAPNVKDSPPVGVTTFDDQTGTLINSVELEDIRNTDLHFRADLLEVFPRPTITTSLVDAHIYILDAALLPLILDREEVDSLRMDFLPWLCKWSYQAGIVKKWSTKLAARRDPFRLALCHSSSQNTQPPLSISSQYNAPAGGTTGSSAASQQLCAYQQRQYSMVQSGYTPGLIQSATFQSSGPQSTMASRAASPIQEVISPVDGNYRVGLYVHKQKDGFFARANTIAAYTEINKFALRIVAQRVAHSNASSSPASVSLGLPITPTSNTSTTASKLIDAKAQVSSDSLLAAGVRVAERATIKRSSVGANVQIGKGAKIIGCVIMDGAIIKEGAVLETTTICRNVVIGERSKLKDCKIAYGYELPSESQFKDCVLPDSREFDMFD